jgi:hypothetical protein
MHEVFKVVVMVFLKLKYLLKISLVIRGVGTGGGGGHRGHVSDQKVVIRWKMKLSGVFLLENEAIRCNAETTEVIVGGIRD